ncbi:MAG: alpha/beta fold hydrolase [Betaproteobacteria bacterium]
MRRQHFHSLGNGGFHRIAYTEWGHPSCAHLVLCVHGLARNSRDFDYLAAALTPECRVLCMDVAGRGESDCLESKSEYTFSTYQADAAAMLARATAPPASGFLQRLLGNQEPKLDWVGTSMGGLIGMFLAAKRNSPIRRLVLNDVGALVPWSALFRMKGYITRGRSFADLAEVEAYLRDVCATFGPLTGEQWRHLARHGARRNADNLLELKYDPKIGEGLHGHIDPEFPIGPDLLRGIDLWKVWSKIECPVLVLRGAESEVLLKRTLQEMHERKPDMEIAEFPGVGHAPALMSEDQIAAVKRFLRR